MQQGAYARGMRARNELAIDILGKNKRPEHIILASQQRPMIDQFCLPVTKRDLSAAPSKKFERTIYLFVFILVVFLGILVIIDPYGDSN